MKFVDEYRDAGIVRSLAEAIGRATTKPWTVMEICGAAMLGYCATGSSRISIPPASMSTNANTQAKIGRSMKKRDMIRSRFWFRVRSRVRFQARG